VAFRYTDKLHGQGMLDEPVLLDVLASPAMQRLHGVSQHGISGLIGITKPVSRFEHSLGVMLIVRRLGAGLEEQVAALVHDISHTAFSHVIDYVVEGHRSQSFHDEIKEDYVAATDLPERLAAHGLNWGRVIQEDRYPLLEQPAPALCADRLDYFLRDVHDLGLSALETCQAALDHLVVHAGRIVVDDVEVARWMGEQYLQADDRSWSDYFEVGIYELTARAIRRGLEIGAIRREDFWRTDEELWGMLHTADDPDLQALLALVTTDTRFAWDLAVPDFWVATKIRTLDPDVLVNGSARPLSTLDAGFAALRAAYLARKTGRWPYRITHPAAPAGLLARSDATREVGDAAGD
jgi:HD superfamily phosphohydrolase